MCSLLWPLAGVRVCVCVCACVSSVTLTSCSSRTPLCLNKLTRQPNLHQAIMWACICKCIKGSLLDLVICKSASMHHYTIHNMQGVSVALKETAHKVGLVYKINEWEKNCFLFTGAKLQPIFSVLCLS